jgi:hypothetical protein
VDWEGGGRSFWGAQDQPASGQQTTRPHGQGHIKGGGRRAFAFLPDDLCLALTLENGKEKICHAAFESCLALKFTLPLPVALGAKLV